MKSGESPWRLRWVPEPGADEDSAPSCPLSPDNHSSKAEVETFRTSRAEAPKIENLPNIKA